MRKRLTPPPPDVTLRPGSPYFWAPMPDMTQAEIDAHLREIVRTNGVQPGCDIELTLLRDQQGWSTAGPVDVIRISAVRRDTSSVRVARWLSETPERTP